MSQIENAARPAIDPDAAIEVTAPLVDDAPVEKKNDDRLHRAGFARRVAELIRETPRTSGMVFGLYAPWGDGKTSVLNLIKEALSLQGDVVVRDFNPWRLTDEEAILKGFFQLLASAANESLETDWEKRKSSVGKLARLVRFISRPLGFVSKQAEAIDKLLERFETMASTGDAIGLEALRARVFEKLSASSVRIVVVVDDIDRLDKAETHTLFRVVKACADFPNVTYLLAMDDCAVAQALADRYGDIGGPSGRAFLEKIVQVPLKLPVAAVEDLRSICLEHVDRVLDRSAIELTDTEAAEFAQSFDRSLMGGVRTPRGAKRYGNALSFAMPTLKGEVNTIELMLLEGIRCFYPAVYDAVRDNYAYFCGADPNALMGDDKGGKRASELLEPSLGELDVDAREAVKKLLVELFPRLGPAYGGVMYGSDWISGWTKAQRVASPTYCPRFFAYGLPSGDVADSEIAQLIDVARAGGVDETIELLRRAIFGASAGRAIQKLRFAATTADPRTAETLSCAVAALADSFPSALDVVSWDSPYTQAGMLVSDLLERIPDSTERTRAGVAVAEMASPVWFAAECIRWLYVTDEPDKMDKNVLTEDELKVVRQAFIHRVRELASAGDPLFDCKTPEKNQMLFEWWRLEGREPVQDHLIVSFERDCDQVGRFLEAMAPRGWGGSSVLPFVGDFKVESLRNVELLIDSGVLAEWVEKCMGIGPVVDDWVEGEGLPVHTRLAMQFLFVRQRQIEKDAGASETSPVQEDEAP